MRLEKLLRLIPSKKLDFLGAETKVDYQVKKLRGNTIFKLILFSMLNSQKLSLRVMESFCSSAHFKKYAGVGKINTRYNSIRDRICTINPEYFEKLFDTIFKIYNHELREEKALVKVDSTYVSIAGNLVNWSLKSGNPNNYHKQIKYGVSLKGNLPCHVRIFTERQFLSENLALGETILHTLAIKESIITFDRGLQSRKVFDEMDANNILFVGRTYTECTKKQVEKKVVPKKPKSSSVSIVSDITCTLRIHSQGWTKSRYRLIKGRIDETQEEICFVTNYLDASPYEIAAIYRQRWDIEIFFRFLKHNLNLNHLVSRNQNGIRVMISMTMILAILILAYKKLNKIKGYKIAKLKFEIELDNCLLKEIVRLCGGNPQKASYLWNSS